MMGGHYSCCWRVSCVGYTDVSNVSIVHRSCTDPVHVYAHPHCCLKERLSRGKNRMEM